MGDTERPNDPEIEQPRDVGTEDGAAAVTAGVEVAPATNALAGVAAAPNSINENNENDEPSGDILTCPVVGIGASAGGLRGGAAPGSPPSKLALRSTGPLHPHAGARGR